MKQPFKIGQKIFEKQAGRLATVTAHTKKGFRYRFDKSYPLGARIGYIPMGGTGHCFEAGFDGFEKWTGKNQTTPLSVVFHSLLPPGHPSKLDGISDRTAALLVAWKCDFHDCSKEWEALQAHIQKLEGCMKMVRIIARWECFRPCNPGQPCIACSARIVLMKKPMPAWWSFKPKPMNPKMADLLFGKNDGDSTARQIQ